MNHPADPAFAGRPVAFLLPMFFVSGATALAYQVIWQRQLLLVFGTSTFAVSTLLAAFMFGLAAGGFLIARHADRFRRPLAVYGWLEIVIGLYALLLPVLLEAITPAYLGVWRAMAPGPVAFGIVQFALMGFLLLLPTAAMGATLPLLARIATRRLETAGDRVGTLYGVNTLGAVVGIVFVGFWLLPHFGIKQTTFLAAAANLLVGAVALALQRNAPVLKRPELRGSDSQAPVGATMRFVVIAIGLAGFSALAYEVSWTRLLALMIGSSAYAFAVMLIAFLAGIAFGAKLGGLFADRLVARRGRQRVLHAFAAIEVGIAVLSWATMYLYAELPFWYVALFDRLGGTGDQFAIWWLSLLLAGLVMTPPAVLMGMHFPLAVRAVVGGGSTLGRPVGVVYGANAIGGAAGAFAAGFILLPVAGVQGTVVVAAMVGLIAAGMILLHASQLSRNRPDRLMPIALAVIAIMLATLRPTWNPLLMTAGMYQYVSRFDDHSRDGILRESVDPYDLVYYEEGLSSVVTVGQYKGYPHRWLAINGKVDASTAEDMPTQVLAPLLPLQFTEVARDVLVIGLASGVSAGAAAQAPGVERIEIVELEPAVARAARYFDAWNHAVLIDPRVELVLNDARNHLLLSEPGRYDLVVSEPSNPWISGVANLFTREFFEIGKSRLRAGGLWSQWVPIYGMDEQDLRSVLKSFAGVYSNVLVYSTIDYNDLVMIGSDARLQPTLAAAERLFELPGVAGELRRAGVNAATGLLALYLMDEDDIAALSGDVPINTDDNLFIEYSTSRKLHLDKRRENFAMLRAFAQLPDVALDTGHELWAELAESYRRRGDARRADAALAKIGAGSSRTEGSADRTATAER